MNFGDRGGGEGSSLSAASISISVEVWIWLVWDNHRWINIVLGLQGGMVGFDQGSPIEGAVEQLNVSPCEVASLSV